MNNEEAKLIKIKIFFFMICLFLIPSVAFALSASNVKLGYQYLGEVSDNNRAFVTSIEMKIQATNPNNVQPYYIEVGNFEVYIDGEKHNDVTLGCQMGGCYLSLWGNWYGKSAKTLLLKQLDSEEEISVDLSTLDWVTQSICSDSDGGISLERKGMAMLSSGDYAEDKCSNDELTEFYCIGSSIANITTKCAFGCGNGACFLNTKGGELHRCLNSNSTKTNFNLLDFHHIFYPDSDMGVRVIYPASNREAEEMAHEIAGFIGSDKIYSSDEVIDLAQSPNNHNLISVGTSCENIITSKLEGSPKPCTANIKPSEGYDNGNIRMYENGYIRLFAKDGKVQIVVEAKEAYYMGLAKDILLHSKEYNFDLDGTDVTVQGKSYMDYGSSLKSGKLSIKECYCQENACKNGPVCTENNRQNLFKKGYVDGLVSTSLESYYHYGDFCSEDGIHLIKYYCVGPSFMQKHIQCVAGCQNGACLPFSHENETNKLNEGIKKSGTGCPGTNCSSSAQGCLDSRKLSLNKCEIYIKINNNCNRMLLFDSTLLESPCEPIQECIGCELNNNSCVPIGTTLHKEGKVYYCASQNNMSEQKIEGAICKESYECSTFYCLDGFCKKICYGCLNDQKTCLDYGTRNETNYCNKDSTWTKQKVKDDSCSENYECVYDFCEEGICKKPGVIRKLSSFFKSIFH